MVENSSTYYDQEIRRKDEKIRSLGTEIESLQKRSDESRKTLTDLEERITKSQEILTSIDDVLSFKNSEFEHSKAESLQEIDNRNQEMIKNEEDYSFRLKTLKDGEDSLKSRNGTLESVKTEAINHLLAYVEESKKLVSEFEKTVNENIELIKSI